ncbi:MAG TPA: hypothetical protein VM871_10625, partial [Flavisolibacter sp.]|nr:hypothetical protein [Flavisolibacter sp.]
MFVALIAEIKVERPLMKNYCTNGAENLSRRLENDSVLSSVGFNTWQNRTPKIIFLPPSARKKIAAG